FPGENQYEWMAPEEFYRRWKMGGSGWAVVLLNPPPPPIPVNAPLARLLEPGQMAFFCGQCSDGSCGPVRIAPILPTPVRYHWRSEAGTPQSLYWCRGDVRGGASRMGERIYLPYDAATGVWGRACAPPIPLPAGLPAPAPAKVRCRCCPACGCGQDCP